MLQIRDPGGVRRAVGAAYVRDGAGAQKTLDQIRARTANGTNPLDLKVVYQAGIRLAVDPSTADGYSDAKTGPITTNAVVVGVAGGTPNYSHSWATPFGITATNPTSNVTAFTATPPGISGTVSGFATDTVTDANGLTNTISVDITIQRGAG